MIEQVLWSHIFRSAGAKLAASFPLKNVEIPNIRHTHNMNTTLPETTLADIVDSADDYDEILMFLLCGNDSATLPSRPRPSQTNSDDVTAEASICDFGSIAAWDALHPAKAICGAEALPACARRTSKHLNCAPPKRCFS